MNHAPGPWMYDQSIRDDYWHVWVDAGNGRPLHTEPIASVENTYFKSSAEANARLIAAAPDMFEALVDLENDAKQIPAWLWERIQAVIVKAGGRAKI